MLRFLSTNINTSITIAHELIFYLISWFQRKKKNALNPNCEAFLCLINACFDNVLSLFLIVLHMIIELLNIAMHQ